MSETFAPGASRNSYLSAPPVPVNMRSMPGQSLRYTTCSYVGRPVTPLAGLVSEQVVHLARAASLPLDSRLRVRAEEREGEDSLLPLDEGKHRLLRREEEARPACLRGEADAGIDLARVWDEGERELTVGRARLRLADRGALGVVRARAGGGTPSACSAHARGGKHEEKGGEHPERNDRRYASPTDAVCHLLPCRRKVARGW